MNIGIDIAPPYLAKFWISSYGPKCCQPIKLQDSLNCNILTADRLQQIQRKNYSIKEKSFMEESFVFTFPYQINGNHTTEPETVSHIISEWHWKSTFDFSEIVNQLQVEARSSIANCKIYSPIFSETIHTILKIFLQHGLRKCRQSLL